MHSFLAGLKARLRGLRYGFLVIPAWIIAGLTGLAFVLLALDRAQGKSGLSFGVASDAEAARAVLTVAAGSLITVAGVTFSIMVVTLQLVSQQFSPRALRTFLADRLTQVVAGTFVGVFVYAILVLRTVAGPDVQDEQPFVPALSVTAAIVLSVGALVLLLVFIDHITRNIQVSAIAGSVAKQTLAALDTLYPAPFGHPAGDDPEALVESWHEEARPEVVHADRPGFIQSVIVDDVPNEVGSDGLRAVIHVAPGDFVTELDPVATWWPGEDDDGDVGRALRLAVLVADQRDLQQDPGYGVRQLADIATKALSPGINDPTTAWTCIRYLQAIMERLACRGLPDRVRRYESGATIVARQQQFEEYVDAAWSQVARYADDPRIAGALVESVLAVQRAALACDAHDRVALLAATAPRVVRKALAADLDDADRERLERAVATAEARAAAHRA